MRSATQIIAELGRGQLEVIGLYLAAMVLTLAVARWWPKARAVPNQPLWTLDMKLDLLIGLASMSVSVLVLDVIHEHAIAPWVDGSAWVDKYDAAVSRIPLGLRLVLAFLFQEFLGYWRHRAMHWGPLWYFHAIHHSAETVDFTTLKRTHPGEIVIQWVVAVVASVALSPPAEFAAAMFTVMTVQEMLVHANLNWSYGPLGRFFNSPAAHRWHHNPEIGRNHNFGVCLTLFDVLFGTFHLPKAECPTTAGTGDPMPRSFVGLLRYPITREGEVGSSS